MTKKDGIQSSYSPIQCHLYDYIEIACMKRYRLEIVLTDGSIINAKAHTTKTQNKQEWLVLSDDPALNDKIPKKKAIRLDSIKSIRPLDENAEFGIIKMNYEELKKAK